MVKPFTPTEVLDRLYLLADEMAGALEAVATGHDLTVGRLQVLVTLDHEGPLIHRDLAPHLRCSARQVTAYVDGLVSSGHVRREESPTDRRAKVVTLTALGQRIASEVADARAAAAAALLDGIDHRDLQATGRVADALIARLGGTGLTRLSDA